MIANSLSSRSVSDESHADSGEEGNESYLTRNINRERISRIDQSMSIGNSHKRYFTFGLLCFINVMSYYDRVSIAGVLDDVKIYYSISASTAGLLQTSLNFMYLLSCPIYGYLGDRYCRKVIFVCGICIWSTATFASSFIPSYLFGAFLLLRMVVGAGVACWEVLAPTIIADLSLRNYRTRVLSMFYFALPIGTGLGYIMSSELSHSLKSWKWSQRVTPPIGALCVILVLLLVKEPIRGHAEGATRIQVTSILSDLSNLWNTRTFVWLTLAGTCWCFSVSAFTWWMAHYVQFALDFQPELSHMNSGLVFGGVTLVAGIIGILAGSFAVQYLRRYSPRADPLVCAFSVLLSFPFILTALVYMDKQFVLAMVSYFCGHVFLFMSPTIVIDILLYILVPTQRGIGGAVQLFVSQLLGGVLSPYICGLIADGLMKSTATDVYGIDHFFSLQYALYLPSCTLVIGGLCFFVAAFYVVADRAKCSLVTAGIVPPHHVYAPSLPQPVRLAADDVMANDRAYFV